MSSRRNRDDGLRRPAQREVSVAHAEVRTFQGPIPPPEILEHFGRIDPSFPERLMRMAELNQTHRHGLETAVVGGNIRAQSRGQVCAFILGSLAIIGGVIAICVGRDIAGATSALGSLVSLIGLFVYSHRKQSAERGKRREELRTPLQPPPRDET